MVRSSIDYLCQGCACVISAHVKNHLRLRHKCDLHCWQRRWLSLSVPLNQPSLLYWPGGCVSCNGWQSLWWDAGRLSASGLSAWSSAPQMEDSWLTLQEILCCVFVSGDFLKPYHIYIYIYIKIKCQHSVWWQPTVLWYQSGASHLSC